MDKERREKTVRAQDAEADGIIEGRNAVIEALRAGATIDKIFIQKGETDKTLGHIASTARAAGVVVVDADKRKLDFMSRTHAHQGVIALTSVREYVSVEDILNIAREKGEKPLIVVCDEISDPHNLGAIIRTAECAGAHGVVIPKRRSAGLTSVVAKTSAGAVSYVPVARVPNIPALLEQLQKRGRVGLRHGGRGRVRPLFRRPQGPRCHRHRQRGRRYDETRARKVRFPRQHSDEGQYFLAQRLRGGGHPPLRGGAPAPGAVNTTKKERYGSERP